MASLKGSRIGCCYWGIAMALAAAPGCGRVEGEVPDGSGPADGGGDTLFATRGPATKGMDGGAPEPAAAACTPGDRKCDGTTPLSCDAAGTWQPGAACAAACRDGACTDGCPPGTRSCDRGTPRLCSNDGNWQAGAACPFVCQDGACVGTCKPGDSDCAASGAPRTCSASGDWQAGDVCPFLCANGLCVGSCKPGAVRCKDSVPQKCDDAGDWQSGAACPVVCSAGACTDGCTPGAHQCSDNVPQSCDDGGRWHAGANCPYVCAAGICGGVCVPGDARCSAGNLQTCDASGAWQVTGQATRQLLANPSFDDGPTSSWTQVGTIIYRESTALDTPADTPPFLAWLGGYNRASDELSQTVTIPAGAVSVSLAFSYTVFTEEAKKGGAFDFLNVEVRDPNGNVTALGQLSNNDAVSTWTRFGAMLPAALAGKTVDLHFRATTDASFVTSFYVDTVTLEAVGCP